MKNKRGFVRAILSLTLFLIILTLTPVFAQNSTEDKAYTCLKAKVKDKCSELTTEEQAFSFMALAYDSEIQSQCKAALLNNTRNSECWPSDSCKLKETALAIIALDRIKQDTEKAESWLISQNSTPRNLEWYLEIDTNEESSCKISYSGRDYSVTIKSDKKLSAGAGRCLSLSYQNYWLKISESCFNEKFEISCDKDFKTALLYKKQGSETIYVSSDTNPGSAEGKTEERIDAVCFSQAGKCDYEGSLWAALALSRGGRSVETFLPYLTAFAQDNKKFFPEAFLWRLTRQDEYFSYITSAQKPGKYWHAEGSPYTKLYDTALAIFSMQDVSSSNEITDATNYIEENQQSDGCFGSIKDTAFLLYAIWPKDVKSTPAVSIPSCTEYKYYCLSSEGDCLVKASGEVLDNYVCSKTAVCCSKELKEETCSDKHGTICEGDEECSEGEVSASGTDECCLGNCEVPTSVVANCTDETKNQDETDVDCGGSCENCANGKSCTANSDCNSDNCKEGICSKKEGKGLPWFVWLLIILIIFAVIAIIFRKKLQLFLFKFKKGGKEQAGQRPQGPPPRFPPAMGRIMPRRIIPGMPGRPVARPIPRSAPASESDKELEETFKKLKKISE